LSRHRDSLRIYTSRLDRPEILVRPQTGAFGHWQKAGLGLAASARLSKKDSDFLVSPFGRFSQDRSKENWLLIKKYPRKNASAALRSII
jgi:hypothetical protein